MALIMGENKKQLKAETEASAPGWFTGAAGKFLLAFIALVLFHTLYVFFHWGGEGYKAIISNLVGVGVYFGAFAFAWRTYRNTALDTRSRRAWLMIALGNAAFTAGSVLWTYFENYLGEQPFPSWADAGFLAYFPFMMAGLLLLVEPLRSAGQRIGFALDIAIIMISSGLAMWYVLIDPMVAAGDGFTLKTVLSAAYPVGDLVLLLGIVTILLRRKTFAGDLAVNLVLAGVTLNFVADLIFGYQSVYGTYVSGDWVDALWSIACLPIAFGAHYRSLHPEQTPLSNTDPKTLSFIGLPYVAVVCSFVVLIVAEFRDDDPLHGIDLFLVALLTALILSRQFVVLRENLRAKAAVSELQERIQGIYSASIDGIGVADRDGRFLEANDALARMTGYTREELMSGITIFDLTAERFLDETRAVNDEVIASQGHIEYEKEYVRKDGTTFTASVTVFPLGPDSSSAPVAAMVRDITEKRRAEEMLREAEERWQLALRVNRDGVWDWDLRSEKYYFSPRWREMFGYGREEEHPFDPSEWTDLFHPEDLHLAETIRNSLARSDSPYADVEFRHRCADGSYRWIRCRAEALIDPESGRMDRIVGLNTDISEKKRQEMEQEAIGAILRGVSETSNLDQLLELVHESIGRFIFARNCFVALFDPSTERFTMQFFVDEHDERPPNSLDLTGTRSHYVFRSGQPLFLDEATTAKLEAEGKFRLVGTQPKQWLGVPLRTPSSIIGVLVVQTYDEDHSYDQRDLEFLDKISGPIALAIERKRDESRMLLLNTALEAAANGIVITDGEGNIKWVNQTFTSLTGFTQEEARGRNPRILRSGKQSNEFYSEMWKTIKDGKVWKGELTNRRKYGELYEEEMTITPLFDRSTGERHFIAIKNDISDRKLAEQQIEIFNKRLQQSNRELQDFAYVASHDLQEPLRKVQTFSDRLKSKYADRLDETGIDYLERMRSAANRMQKLIQDLLSFSRVTTKAQPFVSVDLEKIVSEVLSDLEVKIEETGALVATNDLPVIDADPLQMRQLLQNLIGNALKFRRDGVEPHLSIIAEPMKNGNSGNYKITVEDNGIGFDEKYLDKIFTVFQRLHGRTEYEGSGIGLAVCRKIVERHHGTITAESSPGNGAKFIVHLPARQSNGELN